jgi:hypothetical protein
VDDTRISRISTSSQGKSAAPTCTDFGQWSSRSQEGIKERGAMPQRRIQPGSEELTHYRIAPHIWLR